MVGTTITTRGRRRPQRANSAQGAGRPRITTPSQNRKKGRGWHTNREGWRAIVGKSPPVLVPKSETFCPNRLRPEGQEEGGTTGGMVCGAVLCCTVVFLSGTLFESQHRVVTAVLHCCAALRCCAVLHCCVLSGGLFELQPSCYLVVDAFSGNPTVTTPSCHPVVRPHSQHRKVALRGTEVVWDLWLKPGQ